MTATDEALWVLLGHREIYVSKAIIRLAWTRLGVPSDLIEWLVELDTAARVSVRTLWTVEVWETESLAGFELEGGGEAPFTFNP